MELLPIGSVILLKEGSKRLMIYGIYQMDADGNRYDYVGCLYPEGNLGPEHTYVFNHKDIEHIFFVGYKDQEYNVFMENIKLKLSQQ